MALDLQSFDWSLKEIYSDEKIHNLVYGTNPLLAMLPKMEKFKGDTLVLPCRYANPNNSSADFATANAGTGSSKGVKFNLTRQKYYSIAKIDNETMEAAEGDEAAFLSATVAEIDGAIQRATRSIAIQLYGDGTGHIGQVSVEPTENASTFVVTLSDAEQITNFEVGMSIVIYAATSGGSALHSDGTDDEWTVAAVDRDAGTVTLTGTYSSSGNITANAYIFPEGDRGSTITGLSGWIPASAPSASESFFGVDRSVDASRLGGIRVTGTGLSIEEALIKLASRIAREGGRPDVCFVNFEKYRELETALGSKVQYVDVKSEANIGFTGIRINGPRGPIKVVPDQNCTPDVAYMLQMDTWKFCSLGKAPKLQTSDGLKMLRSTSADQVEIRVVSYAQLGCSAPGFNGRVSLS